MAKREEKNIIDEIDRLLSDNEKVMNDLDSQQQLPPAEEDNVSPMLLQFDISKYQPIAPAPQVSTATPKFLHVIQGAPPTTANVEAEQATFVALNQEQTLNAPVPEVNTAFKVVPEVNTAFKMVPEVNTAFKVVPEVNTAFQVVPVTSDGVSLAEVVPVTSGAGQAPMTPRFIPIQPKIVVKKAPCISCPFLGDDHVGEVPSESVHFVPDFLKEGHNSCIPMCEADVSFSLPSTSQNNCVVPPESPNAKYVMACPVCVNQCHYVAAGKLEMFNHLKKGHAGIEGCSPLCPVCYCYHTKKYWQADKNMVNVLGEFSKHMRDRHPLYLGTASAYVMLFDPQVLAVKYPEVTHFRNVTAFHIHLNKHKAVVNSFPVCRYCYVALPHHAGVSYLQHLKQEHPEAKMLPSFVQITFRDSTLDNPRAPHEPSSPVSKKPGMQTQIHTEVVKDKINCILKRATLHRVCPKLVCPARKDGCEFAAWNLKLLTKHMQEHAEKAGVTYMLVCGFCFRSYMSVYDSVVHVLANHLGVTKALKVQGHSHDWLHPQRDISPCSNLRELLRVHKTEATQDYPTLFKVQCLLESLVSSTDLKPAHKYHDTAFKDIVEAIEEEDEAISLSSDSEDEEDELPEGALKQEDAFEQMLAKEKEANDLCSGKCLLVTLQEIGFMLMMKPVDLPGSHFTASLLLQDSLFHGTISKRTRQQIELNAVSEPLQVNLASSLNSSVCVKTCHRNGQMRVQVCDVTEADQPTGNPQNPPVTVKLVTKSRSMTEGIHGSAFSCGYEQEYSSGKEDVDILYNRLPKNFHPPGNFNECQYAEVETMCVGHEDGVAESVKVIVKEMMDDLCYQCPYCNFVTQSIFLVGRHLVSRHRKAEEKQARADVMLKTHTLVMMCRYCDFVTFSKLSLWQHFQNDHRIHCLDMESFVRPAEELDQGWAIPLPRGKSPPPINSKSFCKLKRSHYKCVKCARSSEYPEEIAKHILRHHPKQAVLGFLYTPVIKVVISDKSSHEKMMPNLSSLLRHEDVDQVGQDFSHIFLCLKCFLSFDTQTAIEMHVMSKHSLGHLIFMCSYCEKFFFTRNTVIKHMDYQHAGCERLCCTVSFVRCKGLDPKFSHSGRNKASRQGEVESALENSLKDLYDKDKGTPSRRKKKGENNAASESSEAKKQKRSWFIGGEEMESILNGEDSDDASDWELLEDGEYISGESEATDNGFYKRHIRLHPKLVDYGGGELMNGGNIKLESGFEMQTEAGNGYNPGEDILGSVVKMEDKDDEEDYYRDDFEESLSVSDVPEYDIRDWQPVVMLERLDMGGQTSIKLENTQGKDGLENISIGGICGGANALW